MTHPKAPRQSWRRRHCGWLFDVPANTEKLFQDKAFDFTDWEWHRNAAWRHRWEPVIFFMVAAGYIWQLLHVIFVSILVGLYHEILVPHFNLPAASNNLTQTFGMITFCLSLLLVFRTNSSYSRWWEARTIWGSTVNLSRNYARQVMLWAPPERSYVARLGARWMAVAVHVKRAHLRHKHVGRVAQEAMHLLTPQEFLWLANWRSVPQGAAHVLGWVSANLDIDVMNQKTLQELVIDFIDNLGKCERILRTPLPTAYTRHTSRFLLVYVTLAPALLWSTLGWFTPLFATFIAFLLLGTENIGVQIEEPFKVLPLDTICGAIEGSIKDMELQYFGSCSLDKPATHADDEELPARMEAEAVAAVAKLEGLLVGKLPPSRYFPKHGLNTIQSLSRRASEFPLPSMSAHGHTGLRDSLGFHSQSQSRAGSVHFGQRPHFETHDALAAAAVGGASQGGGEEQGAHEGSNPDSTGAPHPHIPPAPPAGATTSFETHPTLEGHWTTAAPGAALTPGTAASNTAYRGQHAAASTGAELVPQVCTKPHLPKPSPPSIWEEAGEGPDADAAQEEARPLMEARAPAQPHTGAFTAPVTSGPHPMPFSSFHPPGQPSGPPSVPAPLQRNLSNASDGTDRSVGAAGSAQDRLLPRAHVDSHSGGFAAGGVQHHVLSVSMSMSGHGAGGQHAQHSGMLQGMRKQLSRRHSVEAEREQAELDKKEEEEEAKAAGIWG